jgi:uncharacterized protein YicC (UPF0701 family)
VARDYVKVLRKLKAEMKLSGEVDLHLVGMIPDLVRVSEAPVDPSREMPGVRRVVQRALAALGRDRCREGAYLGGDMRTRVGKLERLILDLRRFSRSRGRSPSALLWSAPSIRGQRGIDPQLWHSRQRFWRGSA